MHGLLDWYNRIHFFPRSTVFLSNPSSNVLSSFYIWNASLTNSYPLSFSSIDTTGIQLTNNTVTPITPLRQITNTARLMKAGPAISDARYTWTLGGNQVFHFYYSVERGVHLPYSPNHGVTEGLEWKTDVIRTKAAEQRVAVRSTPRHSLNCKYTLSESAYSRVRALTYKLSDKSLIAPFWNYGKFIGGAPQGTTSLALTTSIYPYEANGAVLVWESPAKYELREILSVTGSALNLKIPLQADYSTPMVLPVRSMFMVNGMEATRNANNYINVQLNLQADDFISSPPAPTLPTFEGLDVMSDVMMMVSDFKESVFREVYVVDNGIGTPTRSAIYPTTGQGFTVSWDFRRIEDVVRIRNWLWNLRGKQKAFWLPTRRAEVFAATSLVSAANSITMQPINFSDFYGEKYIMIRLKSGAVHYKKAIGSQPTGNNLELLQLSSTLGFNASIADIDFICFMHKVRLDTDRVEIDYNIGEITVSLPVVEVPQ
jgi:hypothetical protein